MDYRCNCWLHFVIALKEWLILFYLIFGIKHLCSNWNNVGLRDDEIYFVRLGSSCSLIKVFFLLCSSRIAGSLQMEISVSGQVQPDLCRTLDGMYGQTAGHFLISLKLHKLFAISLKYIIPINLKLHGLFSIRLKNIMLIEKGILVTTSISTLISLLQLVLQLVWLFRLFVRSRIS